MTITSGTATFNQIMGASLKTKYHNVPTVIDGIRFDSKAEGRRWQELEILQRARKINDLKRQVQFVLTGKNGGAVCRYRADFMYSEGDIIVVEDVKGVETKDFRIKKKLFNDNFPDIEFRIVKK